jgi:hypothetical protein
MTWRSKMQLADFLKKLENDPAIMAVLRRMADK